MKKIYTLLLLFTITLFYSIPTQAYSLDGNDIPLVQTKNLFDESVSIWIPGEFYASNGTITIGGTDSRLDNYVSVLQNSQYTISTKTLVNVQRIIYYNSLFTFISSLTPVSTTATFTTPANTAYIRFHVSSLDAANATNIQLELGATSTSYAPYGFLTLNEIFLDSNIISNPNFTNGTTGFSTVNATLSVSNQILLFASGGGTSFSQAFQTSPFVFPINNKIYLSSKLRSTNNQTTNFSIAYQIDGVAAYSISQTFPVQNQYYNLSGVININNSSLNNQSIRITQEYATAAIANGKITEINGNHGLFAINLTLLGIDNLTKLQLDNLFNEWRENNIFIQGYNEGYDEGFDDGVASDTSYAVGYALGLSEGEDMETGSSLLILIVALIGFVMMIFGFTTKRGIFNLLSVGAFVVLGTLLVQFVGFVIIAIGLVLINIYYAFFGDL
jgi:hypothetical protein